MNRTRTLWLTATVVAFLCCGSVRAQFGTFGRSPTNSFNRPALSPYLNLSRGGSPAINYFNLVRPQQDAAQTFQGLQFRQNELCDQTQQFGTTPGYVGSGHATSYFNYSHYYPGFGRGGSSGSAPATQAFSLPNSNR